MTIHKVVTTEELGKLIQSCSQKHFTGRLDIEDPQLQHLWSLHFRQGCLVGCASSVHPIRSWCRHLSVHCPELPLYAVGQGSYRPVYWDYNFLAEQVKQGKVLREQMVAVVAGQITEILFDIQQYSERLRRSSKMQLIYRLIPKDTIDLTLVLIEATYPWQQAKQAWEAWQKAGLADYSPNLAPVVQQPEELRQQTSPLAYQNLMSLADGNWTLRDLALKLKQQLLPLSQSIMPYINQGLIALLEVGDFRESFKPVITNNAQPAPTPSPATQAQTQSTSPLIACIDDSQNDSLRMSHILTQAGYRFINVQDPVKALLILLEHKPDLIFLDLVMPIANGYEICAQIRRVSAFKDTPVIILTGNDGIVDRVRAKMVGSSGFLAKPIQPEKVLRVVQRHLAATTSSFQTQKQEKVRAWSKNRQV